VAIIFWLILILDNSHNISELQNENENVIVSQSENLITNMNYQYFDCNFERMFMNGKIL